MKKLKHQKNRNRINFQLRLPKNSLREIVGRVQDFIFPPLCIICDNPQSDNPWFCQQCLDHLRTNNLSRQRCPLCSQNTKFRHCICDVVWEYPFESIYSFLDYDELIQKIMHHIKYFNKKNLAFYMGLILSDTAPDSLWSGMDLIIPVPLHWYRKLNRGYNQAEWFARGVVAKQKHLTFFPAGLTRSKRTKTQVKLHREDRAKNVKNVFAVPKSAIDSIKNRSIVLIDDVITTGATTASCAEALLQAGCNRVKVVSLARD